MSPPRKRACLRDSKGKFISQKTASTDESEDSPDTTEPDIQVMAAQPKESAVRIVLGITELLENILINLDPKTLLLSQRVHSMWRDIITTSLPLQRALFLEPVSCGNVTYLNWRLDDKGWYDSPYGNLELGEHIRGPDRDQRPNIYPEHWGQTREDEGCYQVFVNPLLVDMFPVLGHRGIYWHETFEQLSKAAQREEASWRRMFFTQPPINCMAVEYDTQDDEDGDREEVDPVVVDWTVMAVRKARGSKGLTMHDLFYGLVVNYSAAWIEGRHMWEEYTGAEDLKRVVVKKKKRVLAGQ